MTYFVSGATGYLGQALVKRLAETGATVHALYRSPSKTDTIRVPGVRLFHGDLLVRESIKKAMAGCRYVFHTGAKTQIWCKNKDLYHQINVQGTKNVIECALELDVKKAVITSTAGVFGPSEESVDESKGYSTRFFTEYERTKAEADRMVEQYTRGKMAAVIVHPTRIYGPGPRSQSNSVTRMIELYLNGKWHFILGSGQSMGNYVYIDDVVNGHIAAMGKGCEGDHYILGGENTTYNHFFHILRQIAGRHFFLLRIPLRFVSALSRLMMLWADLCKTPPALTPDMVDKLGSDWKASSRKAESELNYSPTPLSRGLMKTISWIQAEKDKPNGR